MVIASTMNTITHTSHGILIISKNARYPRVQASTPWPTHQRTVARPSTLYFSFDRPRHGESDIRMCASSTYTSATHTYSRHTGALCVRGRDACFPFNTSRTRIACVIVCSSVQGLASSSLYSWFFEGAPEIAACSFRISTRPCST